LDLKKHQKDLNASGVVTGTNTQTESTGYTSEKRTIMQYSPDGLSPSLRGFSFGWSKPKILVEQNMIKKVTNIFPSGHEAGDVLDPSGISETLRPMGVRGSSKVQAPKIIQYGKMRSQKPQRWDGIAHTVRQDLSRNVKKPHNPVLLPDMRIRRLTPVECERLQGFPDNWTKYGLDENGKVLEISDTQRYKLLGNAVTVNVIEFLGLRIIDRCF